MALVARNDDLDKTLFLNRFFGGGEISPGLVFTGSNDATCVYDADVNVPGGEGDSWWVECDGNTKVTLEMMEYVHPWAHYICKIPEDVSSVKNASEEDSALESGLKNNFNRWYRTAYGHLEPSFEDAGVYAGLLPTFFSHKRRPQFTRYAHDPSKGTMRYEWNSLDVEDDVKKIGTPFLYDFYKASVLPVLPVTDEDEDEEEREETSNGNSLAWWDDDCEWSPCLGSAGSASVCSNFNENTKKTDYYLVVKASPDHMVQRYRNVIKKKVAREGMTVEQLASDPDTASLKEIVKTNVRRMAAQFMEVLGLSIPHVLTVEDTVSRAGFTYEPNHARNGLVDVWDLPTCKDNHEEGEGNEDAKKVLFSKNYYLPQGKGHPSVVILPFGGQQFDLPEGEGGKWQEDLRSSCMVVIVRPKDQVSVNAFPYTTIRNEAEFGACVTKWMKMGYSLFDTRSFIRTKTVVCAYVTRGQLYSRREVRSD